MGPSPEACGDGVDNDCDGEVDEGCACQPVAPGAASSFPVSGEISKLIADPASCLVYGLVLTTPSQIVVFDTAQKKELTRIDLGALAVDFDLSPDGKWLVASLQGLKQIAVVDKSTWTASQVATAGPAIMIEVANTGVVYYTWFQHDTLRRIDLALGASSDKLLVDKWNSQSDIELSADGRALFWGGTNRDPGQVGKWDVTVTAPVITEASLWVNYNDSQFPSRYLYLGPGEKHVYFKGHEYDASKLGLVIGLTGKVFAEDASGTFAVATAGMVDARLGTRVATFATAADAAALAAGDIELWSYSKSTGRMTYANVADFLAGKTLGVREAPAEAIGKYTFAKLIADPKRPVLYGLDVKRQVVVSIDTDSGAALRSVQTGFLPADVEIDGAGRFLYVGHTGTYAIQQIDAATLSHVGFMATKKANNDIAILCDDRMATVDRYQGNEPLILDLGTGKATSPTSSEVLGDTLAATADGKTLFLGGAGRAVSRFDVSDGTFKFVARDASGRADYQLQITPDGSIVFYGTFCLNGTNLSEVRWVIGEPILSVSPDGKLAASGGDVYRVSDPVFSGALYEWCEVQVIGRDSRWLYCALDGRILTFDLQALN